MSASADFVALSLCVLTVSDTRGPEQDASGDYLVEALREAGHALHARALLPDDR
jgi:molybdenum cofactor biosynthesis protein B